MVKGRKKSKWWKHFGEEKNKKSKCKLCGQEAASGGGTTNLKNHLKHNHFGEFFELNNLTATDSSNSTAGGDGDELEEDVDGDLEEGRGGGGGGEASDNSSAEAEGEEGIRRTPTPTRATTPSTPSTTRSRSVTPVLGTRQRTLAEFKVPDSKAVERYNMAVAYFIATSNLPISLVEKPGFKFLCQVLRPGFQPSGRKAFTENYIPKLYNATKELVREMMKGAGYLSFTSDTWTSKADESYIALTSHFIKKSWEICAVSLCCRSFKEDHTGVNIKAWFLEALEEYHISLSKVTSFTIDNGDNIRLAVDLLDGVDCMRCFGHTVQTGCTLIEELSAVKTLKKNCGKLLQFMSGSKVWNRYQDYMEKHYSDKTARKVPRPVATRWWSALPMFSVLDEDEEYNRGFLAYYAAGRYLNLRLGEADMVTMKSIRATLEPLEKLCMALAGDKYVTASAVLPSIYLIEKILYNVENAPNPLAATADVSMLKLILYKLYKRYSPAGYAAFAEATDGLEEAVAAQVAREQEYVRESDKRGREEAYKLLVKCSYFDGRFRPDLKPEDLVSAQEQLLEEVEQMEETERERSRTQSMEPPGKKSKCDDGGIAHVFAELATVGLVAGDGAGNSSTPANSTNTPRQELQSEMERFELLKVSKDTKPLLWWKVHESSFPRLAVFARKYMAVPATSTESERLFSRAGLIVSALRTCLTGEHAEWLIYMGMNSLIVPKP